MEHDIMSLNNQIAVVTGASRGIGKAIALELGRQGATVVGTATTEQGAAAISVKLGEAGIKGAGKMLNVTDADAIEAFIKAVETEFGGLNILVNNAGITRDMLLMRMKPEDWDAVIDTNLSSVFRLSKAVLRGMMKARKGRIINIASVVGVTGNPGQANYAAAKAGMIGFAKSLAREVGSRGITVNTVAPGFIETDMTEGLPKDRILATIPARRFGRVDEVAACVRFLTADDAGYVTGQVLGVNGGVA